MQLALGLRHRRLEPAERLLDLGLASRASSSPCKALLSALACAFGGFFLAALPARAFFTALAVLRFAFLPVVLIVFFAMFALY